MKVVLAEKPSVARDLAAFLGAGQKHEGYFEGSGYQVSWALGHLVELKEPQDYDPALKRWSLASLPFVPERFELRVIEDQGARRQFSVVRRLFKAADELICATDAGREGELIFRYILEMTGSTRKPVKRLWLSSLTEEAIRTAFRKIKPASDYDRLYAAARCRSESDWIVGLNATRFYTVRFGARGLLWSVGRVQTPVLAMIVGRDDEIRTFRPEPFWELKTRYRDTLFKHTGERFKKQEEADQLLKNIGEAPFVVDDVRKKPEKELPPQLFDLTELQRFMNRRHGMSAAETLKAAQSLYEAKVITYPRTDSRYLTADMKDQVPGILRKLETIKHAEIAKLELDALPFTGRIVDDKKVSDHHAIIPTGKISQSSSGAEQKVFDAVVTRLIAAFYPACAKQVTTVEGSSAGVPFRARGVRIEDPGWTVLYPRKTTDKKKEEEQELPAFEPRESGPHDPFVEKGETTPPKPFTENTLLGAMETAGKLVDDDQLKEALKEKGLGTPATRAAIIETLLRRGYIVREQKNLAATDLGRYLIAVIHHRALKSPEMTGEWEARLREIEGGRMDPRRFMEEIVQYTSQIVETGGSSRVDESRLGDCPRCGKNVIEGRRGYGCSGWKEGCVFVMWKEHDGMALDLQQVRELLQHRSSPKREAEGDVLLSLASTGAIVEVPVPKGPPATGAPGAPMAAQMFGKRTKGKAPRPKRDVTSSTSGTSPKRREPRAPKEPREPKGPAGPLGKCPTCGSEVVEGMKGYGCKEWRTGCKFVIWKTIAGKKISARTAKALLTGKNPELKGFKSKAGKPFDARLKLEDGQVRFDFDRSGAS